MSGDQHGRLSLLALLASTTLLFGCGDKPSVPSKAPLTFYIVSSETIEGGRFIDTEQLPKLGYIPAIPALELRKLDAVAEAPAMMATGSSFHIKLTPDDARRFAALTEQAMGKQMLLMLGDTPLMAVRVMSPIAGPSLQLHIDERHNSESVRDALRLLAN